MAKIRGKTRFLGIVGLRETKISAPKNKVDGETPDFSHPNGFDKLTSLVPMHLVTDAIALGVESGGREGTRPLQFKSLEGTSPQKARKFYIFSKL